MGSKPKLVSVRAPDIMIKPAKKASKLAPEKKARKSKDEKEKYKGDIPSECGGQASTRSYKSLPQTSSAKMWRAMALCVCARECGEWSREGDQARERKPRRFLDVTVIFSARYVRNPDICKHLSVEYRLPLSPGIWIAAVLSRVPT
jgi:hypothetical protein